MAAAWLTACGGTVVEQPGEQNVGGEGAGGGSGRPLGCALCDGSVDCNFCLIHGSRATYRCPTTVAPPESGCLSLGETHRDAEGLLHTCHYCN